MAESVRSFGAEAISVGASAVGLDTTTHGLYGGTTGRLPDRVEITVRGAQIRWRSDGTAATAAVGQLANPFDTIVLTDRNDMVNFSAIQVSSAATLWVNWEQRR